VGGSTIDRGVGNERSASVPIGRRPASLPDGPSKFKDFPKDFGGSGDTLPE
jgi:hypothetical protein